MPWSETNPMKERLRSIDDLESTLYTMTELSERYGSQPDIKIVSKRRSGNRLRLKVAVTLPPRDDGLERSEFATCLVTRSKKPASP